MAKQIDPAILAHLEWIGFVRPTGLVISAPAMVRAGAILPRNDAEGQRLLTECVAEQPGVDGPVIADFHTFARTVLGWSFSPKGYAGVNVSSVPSELQVPLLEYDETLSPDLAVRELDPSANAVPWQLLIQLLPTGQAFDRVVHGHGRLEASAHSRMERLLRQTGVSAGLLFNGSALRLISAPRGESSGWLDFCVADMLQTAGRPIIAALRLLLSEQRLLALPHGERLAALLEESRKFQNEVSERLAEQVLHALYALLRGFQAANDDAHGVLLRGPLNEDPDAVYRALLTVILRLVFLLYAEERDMLPADEIFLRNYSLAGLYERLREDAALYPDTMQQRYGAWAQLLVLFRMIHDGVDAGDLRLPRRHGALFDPDRFPFLESRADDGVARQIHQRITPPRVPDGIIYQALEKLLLLDGERISYRALDVEQIGSVYETMMGFRLEAATGRSVAIKAQKKHGAPTAIDLEALLREPATTREKWIQDRTDRKLTDKVKKGSAGAVTLEDLHAALLPVIDLAATPDLVPQGAMVLQPSEERRRSGSHYTPRVLTEPIVRTTLEPILARLRGADSLPPRPAQILDLKICDPAMGSGAFLVEACRQLGDALIEAWHAHGEMPTIPPDEDEVVYARRLVAQRCLYGVDKNPTAVDLAKVSLWLVTLAKEHALTFVDHALRHGDSLVGLSRRQIEAFHWLGDAPRFQAGFETMHVREHIERAAELRAQIRHAGESISDAELNALWRDAQDELAQVRLYGDLVLAAFFEGSKDKERETKRLAYAGMVLDDSAVKQRGRLDDWRNADLPLVPFHWEIEFPEVFQRENGGFDAVVGNPPFLGGGRISSTYGLAYLDWVLSIHEEAHGNGDLVAHFFRRAFTILRANGAFGLIASNTIAQGDTRSTGLCWICNHGGEIYNARKRVKWPGQAAVTVSTVHIAKGSALLGAQLPVLDGHTVQRITAYLFHRGGDDDPAALSANADLSFEGSKVYGQGFIFDDHDPASTPLTELRRLVASNPLNQERIFPYISGSEVNSHPNHDTHRYVIDFRDMELSEAAKWPALLQIIETRVKPERAELKRKSLRERWWIHGEHRPGLYRAVQGLRKVLVNSKVSQWLTFAFVPTGCVYSHNLNVFALSGYSCFCCLQSRTHETWVRFTSSTLEDRLGYRPTDCFETFPFPPGWETHLELEAVGKVYYEYRAALMLRNNEGMTDTYNRFHDPFERDLEIERLRVLHAIMDRAVLDAYGWQDVPTDCEFLLDYEIDEAEWGTKKKPYRYRWPDVVRDEVLARLLELNAQRAREEKLVGLAKGSGKGRKAVTSMRNMFND